MNRGDKKSYLEKRDTFKAPFLWSERLRREGAALMLATVCASAGMTYVNGILTDTEDREVAIGPTTCADREKVALHMGDVAMVQVHLSCNTADDLEYAGVVADSTHGESLLVYKRDVVDDELLDAVCRVDIAAMSINGESPTWVVLDDGAVLAKEDFMPYVIPGQSPNRVYINGSYVVGENQLPVCASERAV